MYCTSGRAITRARKAKKCRRSADTQKRKGLCETRYILYTGANSRHYCLFIILVPSYLNTVVARGDASVLNLDVFRRVGELALVVGAGTFVSLELATDLELQPARVLLVQQRAHVDQRRGGGLRRRRRGSHRRLLLLLLLDGGGLHGGGRGGVVQRQMCRGQATGRQSGRGHVLLVRRLRGGGRGGRGRRAVYVGHVWGRAGGDVGGTMGG